MDIAKINDYECPLKNQRDRIGMCTSGDSDIPGNVSGLQRLHHKKFNKVSASKRIEIKFIMSNNFFFFFFLKRDLEWKVSKKNYIDNFVQQYKG